MHKIASPQDLQSELRRILAYTQGEQPSRQVLASELQSLADRVAADPNKVEGLTIGLNVYGDSGLDWDSSARRALADIVLRALEAYKPKLRGRELELVEGVVLE